MRTISVSSFLLVWSLIAIWAWAAPADRTTGLPADSTAGPIVEDEDVPYGVAASWLTGHRLLLDGDAAAALPYLHLAYRAQPSVPSVALDFEQALVNQGYVQDAVKVMDRLVQDWPDSLTYRLERSALAAHLGDVDAALADLRHVRQQGLVDLEIVGSEAALLVQQEKFNQALDVYRDALEVLPQRAEDLYLGMATVLQQADRQEDMVDLMSEAVAAQPRSATLRVVYLRALAGNGLHDEAREAALQADRDFADRRRETGPQTDAPPAADEALQDPTVEFAEPPAAAVQPDLVPESFLIELADFYALRGEYDRAAGLLEPLYAAGDLDLSPSLWLARIYLGSGRQNDGLRLIEEILERWPDSGRAWYLRGNIAEAAEDGAEALTMYRRAVDLAGDDPEIRLALVRAMLLFWEGDLARDRDSTESRNRLKELKLQTLAASTVVPERDTQGHLILGYAHKTVGQYEAAIGSFRLAARNKDLHLRALIQISICQDEADQDDAARKTLKLLRQEYPDDPEVANSLGYFLAEKDLDLEYAESLVGEALQHDAGNGAYLDSLGWVYYRQGRLDEALDYLIRAVNVLPDDPIILEHLGIVLHEHGRAPEAVEMLQRSLNAGGDRDRLQPLLDKIAEQDTSRDR